MRYTEAQDAWLRDAVPLHKHAQTAALFAERFGVERSAQNIADWARRHKVKSPYSAHVIHWDAEMDGFLREVVPGHMEREIRELFAQRFGIVPTIGQLANRKVHLGLRSGTNGGQLGSGTEACRPGWNKGMRWADYMTPEGIESCRRTLFRKGEAPWNTRPVGSEWAVKGGQVYVKVRDEVGSKRFAGDDGRWVPRARIVWEREHGPIPEGMLVFHADGDAGNDDPANLVLVSNSERGPFNMQGYRYYDMESMECCLAAERLRAKARQLGRGD